MSRPTKIDYALAIGVLPTFGLLAIIAGFLARPHNGFWLENGVYVKNGSPKWVWYRLLLGWQIAPKCRDCKLMRDSAYTTENLCECAFLDDLKGMEEPTHE